MERTHTHTHTHTDLRVVLELGYDFLPVFESSRFKVDKVGIKITCSR